MRNGAVTHAFDMDQRYVGAYVQSAARAVLNVTGPPNGNIAPPGYYMLFILNSAGVPSVATIVQLSLAANDTPPTGTITSPSSDSNYFGRAVGDLFGTGNDPMGTISALFVVVSRREPQHEQSGKPGKRDLLDAGHVRPRRLR